MLRVSIGIGSQSEAEKGAIGRWWREVVAIKCGS